MSATAPWLRSRRGWARLAAVPQSRLAAGAFALLAVYALIHLYRKGVNTSFYYDEWTWILGRHGGGASTFLEPHNEHLSLVPVAIYKLLWATVGLDHYGAYRIVVLVLHVTVAALLFAFVRRRVGDWLALAAAAMLLFLGAGWEDILWPFQIGYMLSVASGLGALLLLDRDRRGSDAGAALALAVALASSSLGIPMAIGAFAYLVVRPARRARLWVVAAPLALYALWYLGYGKSALKRENFTAAPGYSAEEVAGATAGVTGLPVEWGRTLAVAAVAALIWRMSRVRELPRSFAMVLVAAASFWGLTALARADVGEPAASRYLYAGGLFVLMIAAEALRGWLPSRLALGLVGAGALLAVVSGLGEFHDAANGLRSTDQIVKAEITPLEIGAGRMPADFQPEPAKAPQIEAGGYIAAVEDIGSSPAFTEKQLAGIDDGRRRLADGVFTRGYGLRLLPASALGVAAPGPVADQPIESAVITRGACVLALPQTGSTATVAFTAPAGGVSIRAPGGKVALRRFADSFGDPLPGSAASALLRIPSDRSSRPWHVRVSGAKRIQACGVGS